MRMAELFVKRGSNQREMSSPVAGSVAVKKTAGFKEPCGFYYYLLFALSPRRPRDQPYANRQCLCDKLVWANASGAISITTRVTIVLFMMPPFYWASFCSRFGLNRSHFLFLPQPTFASSAAHIVVTRTLSPALCTLPASTVATPSSRTYGMRRLRTSG